MLVTCASTITSINNISRLAEPMHKISYTSIQKRISNVIAFVEVVDVCKVSGDL